MKQNNMTMLMLFLKNISAYIYINGMLLFISPDKFYQNTLIGNSADSGIVGLKRIPYTVTLTK